MSNSAASSSCFREQRGVLRGLHGQREEDRKEVRYEVHQEEKEEGHQPGK